MQPTIDMCRNGIEVSWSAVKALKGSEELILKDPGMRYEWSKNKIISQNSSKNLLIEQRNFIFN